MEQQKLFNSGFGSISIAEIIRKNRGIRRFRHPKIYRRHFWNVRGGGSFGLFGPLRLLLEVLYDFPDNFHNSGESAIFGEHHSVVAEALENGPGFYSFTHLLVHGGGTLLLTAFGSWGLGARGLKLEQECQVFGVFLLCPGPLHNGRGFWTHIFFRRGVLYFMHSKINFINCS